MALQIWLPLTKDLRNQGLNNTTVTNSGATYSNTGGKLGGCYSFDGTDDAIGVGNLSTMVDTEFSWSCWFYRSEWSSKSWETIFGGPSGFELETKNSSTNSPLMYAYSWGKGTFTYELNQWNHLVMTRTTSETKFYLNGELKLTGSAGSIPSGNYFVGSWSSTTGQNFKGKVNDVRIYDHCLSPMEVKELSKGLVLHYPLNRGGWGQENLIANSGSFSSINGWTNNQNTTLSVENNELKVVMNQTTSTPGIKSTNTIDLSAGTYVASLLIKVENGNKNYVNYPFYLATSGGTVAYSGAATKREERGEYIYEEATFTLTSAINGVIVYILTSGPVNGEIWHIKWVKLEEGSVATPWCPNSSDALATTMGLNGTTEYDCSGYCNNGTRTGMFSWTSDTPKYSVSTYFEDGSISYITTSVFMPTDKITTSVWFKGDGSTSGANSYHIPFCIGSGYAEFSVDSSKLYRQGYYINGTRYCDTISGAIVNDGNWHMMTATYDGTTLCRYLDGQLINSKNISGTLNGGNLILLIGKYYSGGYNNKKVKQSDVRIYATALSADDVKSLYQNCATIDADGTIHGQIRS